MLTSYPATVPIQKQQGSKTITNVMPVVFSSAVNTFDNMFVLYSVAYCGSTPLTAMNLTMPRSETVFGLTGVELCTPDRPLDCLGYDDYDSDTGPHHPPADRDRRGASSWTY